MLHNMQRGNLLITNNKVHFFVPDIEENFISIEVSGASHGISSISLMLIAHVLWAHFGLKYNKIMRSTMRNIKLLAPYRCLGLHSSCLTIIIAFFMVNSCVHELCKLVQKDRLNRARETGVARATFNLIL